MVHIVAAGQVAIDGLIDVRGSDGNNVYYSSKYYGGGGGGAGGSIYVEADQISGDGQLLASGGGEHGFPLP